MCSKCFDAVQVGQRFRLGTGVSVESKFWNQERQEFRSTVEIPRKVTTGLRVKVTTQNCTPTKTQLQSSISHSSSAYCKMRWSVSYGIKWSTRVESPLNDAPINAATSDTLLLSNVSTSQQGRYRCTVGSACGSTPSAEAVISVGSLAVRDEDSKYQLLVSPQPASDVARITTPFAISTSARIQLHNVDGVNVAHAAMISTSSPTSLNISLISLPQGTYTLVLHDGSVLLKQIIVVKR